MVDAAITVSECCPCKNSLIWQNDQKNWTKWRNKGETWTGRTVPVVGIAGGGEQRSFKGEIGPTITAQGKYLREPIGQQISVSFPYHLHTSSKSVMHCEEYVLQSQARAEIV